MPDVAIDFCKAHQALRAHFGWTRLAFTLDGKLVGDIAEAIAAQHFDLELCSKRTKGVDAHTRAGRSVQIKATGGKKRGAAFTPGEGFAEYLIFLRVDFEEGLVRVLYNGPEAPVRALLPPSWSGTFTIPLAKMMAADRIVEPAHRLVFRN